MRQIFPSPAELDAIDVYDGHRPPADGRPWVVVDMITSADGAIAVEGRSGGLGGPADKEVFRALRAAADVVLVGAGTARAERYGPVRADAATRERRLARGQDPVARLVVVSGSLDLDPDAAMFAEAERPPVLLTTGGSAERRAADFAGRAELVGVGDAHVDLGAGLAALHGLGARVVLVEGGPTLNGLLVAQDLVDEWCVSIAPLLVGGEAGRAAQGPAFDEPRAMQLHRLLEADGYLFATYRRLR